jgi:ABC-type polysaccharide/polyol phosphate export permease
MRALNEILRVPGATIPGVLAPTIFMIGLSGVFGKAAQLPGFDASDFRTFIVAVGMLQGAGFTGAATGVNLARDIEAGWFDRLLVGPAPRTVLLAGVVLSAAIRSLIPATFLVIVAVALGTHIQSVEGVVFAFLLVMGMAAAWACWGAVVALRFKTQQAAPLMQVLAFASILFTTAYAPEALLSTWLAHVADYNPVRYVLEGARQGFVTGMSWPTTFHAMLALSSLLVLFGGFAIRGMRRVGV